MAQRPEPNLAGAPGGGAAGGRGGSGGGGGPTLASAGLDFDTTGLEKFTKALKDAATAAAALWKPFTEVSKQRSTLKFLDDVKQQMKHIRGDAEAVGTVGVGVGGGGDGKGKRSAVGGGYNMPTLPGSLSTGGGGAAGLAWNAKEMFQAGRKNGGDSSIPSMPRTGRWGTAAVAASVLGSKMGEAQRVNLPDDVSAQFATARAMMTGGTGGRSWSEGYLNDRTLAVQGERRGFSDRKDVTAAQMIGGQIGVTPGAGGAAGRRGEQWMESTGVVARATGMQGAQVAQIAAGMQSADTSNTLMQYGILTSPGGTIRPLTAIYKDMLAPVFGTARPTLEQILAARLPGQPGPRRVLEHIYSGDAAAIDAFLVWVEANAATGKTITTMAQAEQSPLAKDTKAGTEQELLAGRGRRHAGEAEGRMDVYGTEMEARIKLNQIVEDQYDRFEKLGLWVGRLQGAFETLTRVMGSFTTLLTGWMAGKAIKAVGGATASRAALAGAATTAGAVALGVGATVAAGITYKNQNEDVAENAKDLKGKVRTASTEKLVAQWKAAGPGGALGGAAKVLFGEDSPRKMIEQELSRRGLDKHGNPQDGGVGDPVPGAAWSASLVTTGIGDPVAPAPSAPMTVKGKGVEGLNADFKNKLGAMFATNPKLFVKSGFRTYAEQAYLYDRYVRRVPGQAPAAKPGHSNHEKGLAADIGPRDQEPWLAQNAAKFGLKMPMDYEPWHWEPTNAVGGATAPAAGVDPSVAAGGAAATDVAPPEGGGPASGGFIAWGPNLTPPGGLFGGGGGGGAKAAVVTAKSLGTAPAAGSPAAAGAAAPYTGGSGPGGAPAGLGDVLRLAKSAGFSGMALQTIAAIAMGESNLNPKAQGDLNLQDAKWGPSVGLWQVRTLKGEKGKGTTRDFDALMADPSKQAKSAWEISRSGTMFTDWTVFTSGAYKKNMAAVQAAMTSGGIGDPIGPTEMTSPPPNMLASAGMRSPGSGSRGIVIHNLDLRIEIARGTPEEAERTGQTIVDILADRNRLLAVGDE